MSRETCDGEMERQRPVHERRQGTGREHHHGDLADGERSRLARRLQDPGIFAGFGRGYAPPPGLRLSEAPECGEVEPIGEQDLAVGRDYGYRCLHNGVAAVAEGGVEREHLVRTSAAVVGKAGQAPTEEGERIPLGPERIPERPESRAAAADRFHLAEAREVQVARVERDADECLPVEAAGGVGDPDRPSCQRLQADLPVVAYGSWIADVHGQPALTEVELVDLARSLPQRWDGMPRSCRDGRDRGALSLRV